MCSRIAIVAACLGAAAARAEADTTVEILGNERTDRDVILTAARIPDGPIDDAAIGDVRQRLLNLHLFASVDVTRDAAAITIRVKERWTLLPIPFVATASRGNRYGLLVLESNFLGLNKTIGGGGWYASWGHLGFAFYRDPSVGGTRATLATTASYEKSGRERRIDDEVVAAYDDTRVNASLLGGYRFTDRFSLAAGWFVTRAGGEVTSESPAAAMLATSVVHGAVASLDYRGADAHGIYDEGLTVSAQVKAAWSSRNLVDATARAQYTHAFLAGQPTTVFVQADAIDGDPILDVRLLGGRVGTRGFELQTLWVDRAATVTLDHQVPVFARGWGVVTLAAFVDAGAYALDHEHDSFVTPGAGMRVYLPKTSFPALGVDVSYSFESSRVFTTVSLGLAL